MPPLPIIIALVILLLGAVTQARRVGLPQQTLSSDVHSQSAQEATPTQTDKPSPTPTRSPTQAPSPTPSKDPDQAQKISLSAFVYPNAAVKNSDGNSLTLESNDYSDAITNWYKEKIKSIGMNAKSFVTTKTNGKVLNKLVGANGKTEIRVEITKPSSENTVRIVVTIHTS